VPLGSRKQLCINGKVRDLAKNGNDERMNEACLDMQKAGKYPASSFWKCAQDQARQGASFCRRKKTRWPCSTREMESWHL